MTERFDTPDTASTSETDVPVYGGTDPLATTGTSETVTRSAAVDEATLGQAPGTGSSSGSSAKEHAGAVAQDAKESTKNVASTAATEAKDVAQEAKTQIRQLFNQLTGEATDQASGQTQRAVGGLRSLSSELSGMAQSQQGESGMASDLARQGASRLDAAASWLEGRQPGEILDEVRSFARRRPGTFIAGAAILGIVGGRLTRGLTGDSSSQSSTSQGSAGTYGVAGSPVSSTPYGAGTAYGQTGAGTAYAAQDLETGYAGETAGPAYGADPLDLEGTDPSRVDAGIDPATYTHPGSSTGVSGETR
ncbi:hypothetical protein [Terrabacter tumescens]|nr:hypothetical protein [Terrabacter tumescens]